MVASVAVLSDVHGMLHALERVLAEPAVAAAELVVVTGDHTWGPQPAEVLDRLLGLGDRVVLVRGNADRELLQMSHGLDVGLEDEPLSVWGAEQLTTRHQELLEAMPESVTLDVDGFGRVFFSHATPRNDEEVVLVDSRIERWLEVHQGLPGDVETVVAGHTHMPFMRLVDRRLVLNPGSVGLPYGRSGAHWALLDRGLASLGRTLIDPDELIERTARGSALPDVRTWLEETVRSPDSDLVALEEFGPRDGRASADLVSRPEAQRRAPAGTPSRPPTCDTPPLVPSRATVTGLDPAGPDVVLFDLGGVLMDFAGLRRLAELSSEEDGPALRSRWVASARVQAFECGACDAEAFAQGVVDEWGLDLSPAAFLDDFARWSAGPFPGALELVRSLYGTVRMGCVSNTNPVHWQRHLDRWGIVQHLDWTFTSHELGLMKPDPAVFRHVIRTIGTAPDRLLLLDDSEEHVRAARASGMRAEQTRGLGEVQDALRSHLPADSAEGRALRSGSTRPPKG